MTVNGAYFAHSFLNDIIELYPRGSLCDFPRNSPDRFMIFFPIFVLKHPEMFVWGSGGFYARGFPGFIGAQSGSRGPERSSARDSAALLSICEKLAGKDIDRTN